MRIGSLDTGCLSCSNPRWSIFNTEDISVEEAEWYIQNVLNRLPDDTVNDICNQAYEWKTEKMSSDTADYPAGLAEVEGRGILAFIAFGEVELYRNPADPKDKILWQHRLGHGEWHGDCDAWSSGA